ncbi:MAG: Tn3 family transposase [Myxococcota bacterium]
MPSPRCTSRLTASKRSRLSRALVELGRLVKTTYLLRYLADAALRRQVRRQLNRGEARHALAKRLFFGNHGVFRTGDLEQLTSKASALSVLCNAVVFWNTVQTKDILTKLRDERPVDEGWLSFLTPLAHAHVVVNGVYRFDDEEVPGT